MIVDDMIFMLIYSIEESSQNKFGYKLKGRKTLASIFTTLMKSNSWREECLVARGPVGDETDDLHLTVVVESDDSDEGILVLGGGLIELLEDLDWVSAPEHGQLPHCPVPSVIVSWGSVVLTVRERILHCNIYN